MNRFFATAALALALGATTIPALARTAVVQVPCRDMGDGRILIDAGFVPE